VQGANDTSANVVARALIERIEVPDVRRILRSVEELQAPGLASLFEKAPIAVDILRRSDARLRGSRTRRSARSSAAAT